MTLTPFEPNCAAALLQCPLVDARIACRVRGKAAEIREVAA